MIWHKNLWTSMIFHLLLIEKMIIELNFGSWQKQDCGFWSKWKNLTTTKKIIIVMENNTLETITEQQQYRKRSKEECLQKGRP